MGDLRRPGHREECWVLDRKLNLQTLAVGGIDGDQTYWEAAIFFLVALDRSLGFRGVDQAIALDEMQNSLKGVR